MSLSLDLAQKNSLVVSGKLLKLVWARGRGGEEGGEGGIIMGLRATIEKELVAPRGEKRRRPNRRWWCFIFKSFRTFFIIFYACFSVCFNAVKSLQMDAIFSFLLLEILHMRSMKCIWFGKLWNIILVNPIQFIRWHLVRSPVGGARKFTFKKNRLRMLTEN